MSRFLSQVRSHAGSRTLVVLSLAAFLCVCLPHAWGAPLGVNDFKDKKAKLRTAAYGLKQRTFKLRLDGSIDLERGNQLSGAAELAGSVRLLVDTGILYHQHPELQPEILETVLVQFRYLGQHTAAEWIEEEYWDHVTERLDALGVPLFALAATILNNYLPAVEHANELAEAEARLGDAVQALFNAFLLEEEEYASEEEDSSDDESSEEEDSSDDESSEYDDSSSESEEDDASGSSYYSDTEGDSDHSTDNSSDYSSSSDSSDDSTDYEADSDSPYDSFEEDEVCTAACCDAWDSCDLTAFFDEDDHSLVNTLGDDPLRVDTRNIPFLVDSSSGLFAW